MQAKEQIIVEDSNKKEEEEKPLMIKRRKQMQGTIFNPKVLTSHTIPYQDHINLRKRHNNLHQL